MFTFLPFYLRNNIKKRMLHIKKQGESKAMPFHQFFFQTIILIPPVCCILFIHTRTINLKVYLKLSKKKTDKRNNGLPQINFKNI